MVSVPGPTSDAHVLHLVRCKLLLLGGPAHALALDVAAKVVIRWFAPEVVLIPTHRPLIHLGSPL